MVYKKGESGNPAGRPKGTPNKFTTELKQMILAALEANGGQEYLARQAQENPVAFMSLLGRILPAELKASLATGAEPIQINVVQHFGDMSEKRVAAWQSRKDQEQLQ